MEIAMFIFSLVTELTKLGLELADLKDKTHEELIALVDEAMVKGNAKWEEYKAQWAEREAGFKAAAEYDPSTGQ